MLWDLYKHNLAHKNVAIGLNSYKSSIYEVPDQLNDQNFHIWQEVSFPQASEKAHMHLVTRQVVDYKANSLS